MEDIFIEGTKIPIVTKKLEQKKKPIVKKLSIGKKPNTKKMKSGTKKKIKE
ncbi:MAG: hypothetical protein JKY69_01140 [Flavobacteriaceae bacterium]|nr:hypothetical protein [Flavobacteriaceae bacterium]